MKYFLVSIFLLMTFSQCADWEQVTQLNVNPGIISDRVVLVEDFTGASCTNCPGAASTLESLLEKYPNNLIVIGVHSRFLALPAKSGDPYFWTPESEDIEKFLGAWDGKPEAAFNRRLFPNEKKIRIGKPDTWISYLEQELVVAPKVDLNIKVTFDSVTRNVHIELKTKALTAINNKLHLHVALTESNILADQKSLTGILSPYTHNHVLRKLITPTSGEKIADQLDLNATIEKSYDFVLPTDAVLWQADRCSVIAYVSEDENSKYILQAAESKIK